jgi:hypothetical protein
VTRLAIAALGAALLAVGAWQMVVTLRDGSFRGRGNYLIRRDSRPLTFWLNFAALALVGLFGLALIVWAALM